MLNSHHHLGLDVCRISHISIISFTQTAQHVVSDNTSSQHLNLIPVFAPPSFSLTSTSERLTVTHLQAGELTTSFTRSPPFIC